MTTLSACRILLASFVSGAPARRRLQVGRRNFPKWVAETSPRESIRSVEKPGQGRDRGWMSRQPFLALRDVHVVCCHPQEPVADLDILFVIRPVSKFSSAPQEFRWICHHSTSVLRGRAVEMRKASCPKTPSPPTLYANACPSWVRCCLNRLYAAMARLESASRLAAPDHQSDGVVEKSAGNSRIFNLTGTFKIVPGNLN
ncbi:hypothetical protein SAMN05444169_3930 [Bradyrhizobium erythrophlei]|jgi:hypothetical protein|uniref:Uncharacterized protein n=1 Tax=Bradyrhizobium erythrophlei TaxID=1437360 RepID=A0A1M5MCR3_9BRAD|nr:hypothetical protein SAMN05444169_3930 [Bradyrhizobium erythrophlei]